MMKVSRPPTRSLFCGALMMLLAMMMCFLLDSAKAFAPVPSISVSHEHISCFRHENHHSTSLSASKNTEDTSIISCCQTAIASSLLGLVLLCTLPLQTQESRHFTFTPPPAFAIEQQQQVSQQSSVADAVVSTAAVETNTVDPQDLVGIPLLPKQEANALNVLQPAVIKPPSAKYSPIEEVWTLIDKYYMDKTFHGQDWKAVKEKYIALERKSDASRDDMKLATEMVKSLGDKYSRVLDKKQYAAIQKFDLIGVGVTLMPNEAKQIIVGAPPVAGSASDLAGIQVGDFVTAVNGIPTAGKSAFDIIDQISDNPNAPTVTMTIRRQGPDDLSGEGSVKQVVMERTFQQVKDPIQYKISETRSDGTKVGFIKIAEFNSLVKARLEDAFRELQQQGANAFVLDLRGNPGGAFQSAVEISSLFVDNRVATYVVDSNGVELPFKTMADRVVVNPSAPVAIWLDGGSASASEVLAGSLHDNCRAVVMGKQSFGKGLIQAVYGLRNGAGLVLTVAKYVTPSGTEIQGEGVTPDFDGGVPVNLPLLGTDTSRVDFRDIAKRLDPSICQVPTPH